ncbi:MAG: DUF4342 domain-containing protein [Saprospiraceae bacterium]|nr:DUF4342 domain-containing protein [Saprospiraceae bacterium]
MENSFKETFQAHGENLMQKVKELIAEGNVRKIIIHNEEGKEIMSIPLTFGVVGAVFAPVLAAVGALAALLGDCTITVEREEPVE